MRYPAQFFQCECGKKHEASGIDISSVCSCGLKLYPQVIAKVKK